jgi:hypothetical protein
MKTLFVLLFAGMVVVDARAALTIEEYLAKTPEQKLAVLRSKPDQILADASQLLRLYVISLRDPSDEVRKEAARSSIFLMMGLQQAIPAGKAPSFPEKDSNDLQMALIQSLNDKAKEIRGAALNSLAFSASPTPELEKLLLSAIKAEKDDAIVGWMIEALAQAGYDSEQFVSEVSKLFARTADPRAAYSAGKVLGHLKSESALDLLISSAGKPGHAQRHAVQALGAYGAKSAKAKSALEAIIKDQAAPEDIRSLAHISLEAINTDKPPPGSFQPMKLTSLWPLALGAPPNNAPNQTAPVGNSPPSVQPPAPTKVPEAKLASPASEEPTSSTLWSIIVVIVSAAFGLVWLQLKRRP